MQAAQNSTPLQNYFQIFITRKWWVIIPFVVGTIIAGIYGYSVPALYRSSTLILVEPQQIPTAYVTPTVTGTVQDRLNTISQQILSRTNLEKIITQFSLYKGNEQEAAGWLSRFKLQMTRWTIASLQKFGLRLDLGDEGGPPPMEVLVERLRRDIEVKVVAGGNAFTISHVGRHPLTVMQVTNTLASLFIDENLRLREQRAESTSEFLESELEEGRQILERQEKALKEFKERHMGALPGQMEANLRRLDRLQAEIQSTSEALSSAEGRKISFERLRRDLQNLDEAFKSIGDPSISTQLGSGMDRSTSKITMLKEELAKLQSQFNDSYPDIIILKKQISEAEGDSGTAEMQPIAGGAPLPSSGQIRGNRPQESIQYATDLTLLNSEIESLKRRREKAITEIKESERKVDGTFTNEQRLIALTRDYEMSQRNYQGLLDKRLNAKISENLERRQKGEQFRILDPANLPQSPFQPDRRKILLFGSLLSGGLGVGLILLKEYLAPSYRKPEDFQGVVDLPVLGAIPRNKITAQKRGTFATLQEPESFIAEQYRLLYTKITHLSQEKPQTILAISSAMEGEGKTVTALNVALVAARDFGKKTLLIEGDFKSPSLSAYLQQKPQNDLFNVLLNRGDIQSSIMTLSHYNLSVLPVTHSSRNSSGILSSQEMKDLLTALRERYDLILIDSPPILSLPDMNILEQMVDAIILVVQAERTPRDAVVKAINSLPMNKLIGIVLNAVRRPIVGRHHYYYARR